MLELHKVHVYEKVPGKGHSRLSKVNPYVRIGMVSHPPLFVQKGAIYSEGGQRIADPPLDFWEEAAKINEKVAKECGLVIPDEIRVRLAPPEKKEKYSPDEAKARTERAQRSSGTRRRGRPPKNG